MMVINICEGLKYAHARSIIHLDLKPQNILLDNGVPKITDWGLSRLISGASHSVSPLFTVFYAAPEQINGDISDQRTDIWQIGVILYELVTGRLPFTGDSMVEIGMGIATKAPERPGAVNPDAQPLDGIILINAVRFRTQERNRADAIERLQGLLDKASVAPTYRVPTRPTRASKERRLDAKSKRSGLKSGRGKPSLD